MPHSIDERGLLLGGQFIARAFAATEPPVRVK